MTKVRDLVASAHKLSAYLEGLRLGLVKRLRGLFIDAERPRPFSGLLATRGRVSMPLPFFDEEGSLPVSPVVID